MIYVILGPTAVGKTSYSIKLAKQLDAIILNCDAMQMYQELNIGTAKIKEKEKLEIEHYLFDIKNPQEQITIFEYQKIGRELLKKYETRNIVIVGGSGLYLRALLYDYEFEEENKIKYDFSQLSNKEIYHLLITKDPLSKVIHENNRQRVERAYTYYLNNEKSIQLKQDSKLIYDCKLVCLTMERAQLYERINLRVDLMIEEGLEKEVRDLYKKYGKNFVGSTIIGYKEFIQYFENQITYEECIILIKKHSRNYAKKQMTFFKNQFDCEWVKIEG